MLTRKAPFIKKSQIIMHLFKTSNDFLNWDGMRFIFADMSECHKIDVEDEKVHNMYSTLSAMHIDTSEEIVGFFMHAPPTIVFMDTELHHVLFVKPDTVRPIIIQEFVHMEMNVKQSLEYAYYSPEFGFQRLVPFPYII